MSEFEFEPIPGLPGNLPAGETLVWQGAPDWWSLARYVFHLPMIAGYLGLFVLWRIVSAVYDQQPLLDAARGVMVLVLLMVVCCAILAGIAYATARSTVYSVTTERVIMRYGIALPMALNIPFAKIETAAAKVNPSGFGDISLKLIKGEKIAYLMLWPHARPWQITQPWPMLRGISRVSEASAILAQALAAAASRPAARSNAGMPAPATAPAPDEVAQVAQTRRPAREPANPATGAVARMA